MDDGGSLVPIGLGSRLTPRLRREARDDRETRLLLKILAEKAPKRLEEYRAAQAEMARNREREMCQGPGSLIRFFQRAWKEMGETSECSINWHHVALAKALEDIAYGDLRNLIANIPPRHTKSLLCNVCWPAWLWAQPPDKRYPLIGPHVKFLSVSFAAHLAERFGLKQLHLVQSEWYRSLWPHVKIRSDQMGRADFANTRGGERLSASVEAGILGRGGDIQICDDPHHVEGAESAVQREATLRAFSESLPTRITDPRIAARVLIMQRLNLNDCTDWALEHWPAVTTKHLMFPALFDPDAACPEDERTYPGEILWPEVWDEDQINRLRIELGEYAFAGQYLQRPVPREGGIITRNDWQIWPEVIPPAEEVQRTANGDVAVALPPMSYIVASLDTALSERETADWNALVVLGIFHRRRNLIGQQIGKERPWFSDRWTWSDTKTPERARREIEEDDEQPRVVLAEGWRMRGRLNDDTKDRLGRPQGLVQRVLETCRRRRVDRLIIENKTRGKDVADELQRQMRGEEFQIDLFEPNKHGDKVARLYSVQPLFSNGLVYAPANLTIDCDRGGREIVNVAEYQWVERIVNEVELVPRGKNDDAADAMSMALIWLRSNGLLQLTPQYIEEQLRRRVWHGKRETIGQAYGVSA